jgi:uncharacterized protein involved in cysteine biosynthesis
MTSIIVGLVVIVVAAYLLKLGCMYVIDRRRPEWEAERAQLRKDLSRSVKISKRITRHYWRW